MTYPDINPFPLGKIAPTSGTPLVVTNNFTGASALALTNCKALVVYALAANSGNVYVGKSTLNRSTLDGVLAIVTPGETKTIPFDEFAGNKIDLTKFYVDVDTTGDAALPSALYA